MNMYLDSAKKNGFDMISQYDQTDNTMITLDYAKYFIERFINPTIDYGVYSANKNFPTISKLLGFFAQKKWRDKQSQLDLINSDLFRKYRKYMIYLFKKI